MIYTLLLMILQALITTLIAGTVLVLYDKFITYLHTKHVRSMSSDGEIKVEVHTDTKKTIH